MVGFYSSFIFSLFSYTDQGVVTQVSACLRWHGYSPLRFINKLQLCEYILLPFSPDIGYYSPLLRKGTLFMSHKSELTQYLLAQ